MGQDLPCSAARGSSARIADAVAAAGGVHLLSSSAAGNGQMRPGPHHSPRRSVTTVSLFRDKEIHILQENNIFEQK